MKARVYKSTGSWYVAKADDGKFYNCRIKGVFKTENLQSTNPVAVGDIVMIEPEPEEGMTATIIKILDRENYIARSSPHGRHQHHIIASNLDQAVIIVTLKQPRTSFGFIDRFLVTAEAYHIPALILCNKSDLFGKKELKLFSRLRSIYQEAGYRLLSMSIENNEGVAEAAALLQQKTSLICGHSGVGKSSFINSFFPGLNLRTAEISSFSGKGMHTTTFAQMYDLPEGGSIIDTPGIKEFGIFDIEKQELSHYFPEMRRLLPDCQFNNCLHINEPQCAVKEGVNEGVVSEERYVNYVTMLDTIKETYQ